MPELIRTVEYYYVTTADKPGEARKLLEFLSAKGVNIVAFTSFPIGDGKSQLDFFPENPFHFKQTVEEAGYEMIGPKKAFMIMGEDRIGALYDYHLKLSNAGVNVHASNGVSTGTGFGYVFWVDPDDFDKANKAMRE